MIRLTQSHCLQLLQMNGELQRWGLTLAAPTGQGRSQPRGRGAQEWILETRQDAQTTANPALHKLPSHDFTKGSKHYVASFQFNLT